MISRGEAFKLDLMPCLFFFSFFCSDRRQCHFFAGHPDGYTQSCSFPCVGQNRFLATGVNSCTLMGKALRKCTTKRNYSKQVWKHSSVVTGRGGGQWSSGIYDIRTLFCINYHTLSAFMGHIYLRMCVRVCAPVCVCYMKALCTSHSIWIWFAVRHVQKKHK